MEMSGKSLMCLPNNSSTVAYTRHLLDIEKNFDNCRAFTWLGANWTLCYYFMGAYLAAIFVGREFMKSHPPFQLRGALFLWNIALATYSIVTTWRLLPAVVYTIQVQGFHDSFCSMGQSEQIKAVGLWLFFSAFSKLLEFGDTIFIVLRKTPLSFLHWYHHLSVAFYAWYASPQPSPMHTYFTTVNLFIHSIMYLYYAFKVLGVRIPRPISMAITSLQLVQMVFGVAITWYAHQRKSADQSCGVAEHDIALAASLYFSYFVLFLNFFNRSYIVGKKLPESTTNGEFKKIK